MTPRRKPPRHGMVRGVPDSPLTVDEQTPTPGGLMPALRLTVEAEVTRAPRGGGDAPTEPETKD